MIESKDRLPAAIAYIPVLGWLYVILFTKRGPYVMFHLRQSIGLVFFLAVAFISWGILTWIISWIPYGFLVGVVLFTIVLVAFITGIAAWIVGIINALSGRVALLPVFGSYAYRLRI
jgi:uncharacterized membrane protein